MVLSVIPLHHIFIISSNIILHMSNIQVKITVDKETTKEQQIQLDEIADYAVRRARYIINVDKERD